MGSAQGLIVPRLRFSGGKGWVLAYNTGMIGKKFGRYEIVDNLGSGGMAVVYLARDDAFDRKVAIKVLPTQVSADPENRERFRREARAIALLEHVAVVPVYEFGEEHDQLYLVMRYMAGGSLKEWIAHGPLSPENSAPIIRRVAAALDKAHTLRMIHRDIKPSNILFDLEDNPFVSDFGLAKLMESTTQLTHSGLLMTPAYASPEQCRGDKEIDGRTDIYSLTAMLFNMVTGSPPYSADNAMSLMLKHIADPIPRLVAFSHDLPEGLQQVIDRGMAKDPSARYATAGELAQALDDLIAGLSRSVAADVAVGESPAATAPRMVLPGSIQPATTEFTAISGQEDLEEATRRAFPPPPVVEEDHTNVISNPLVSAPPISQPVAVPVPAPPIVDETPTSIQSLELPAFPINQPSSASSRQEAEIPQREAIPSIAKPKPPRFGVREIIILLTASGLTVLIVFLPMAPATLYLRIGMAILVALIGIGVAFMRDSAHHTLEQMISGGLSRPTADQLGRPQTTALRRLFTGSRSHSYPQSPLLQPTRLSPSRRFPAQIIISGVTILGLGLFLVWLLSGGGAEIKAFVEQIVPSSIDWMGPFRR